MKMTRQLLPAAALILFCVSCNNYSSRQAEVSTSQHVPPDKAAGKEELNETLQDYKTPVTDSVAAPQPNQQPMPPPHVNNNMAKEDWDKKIIKTATLNVEVKNYKAFNDLLRSNVSQFGGYVAQEEQNQSEYKIENVVTIKVPVDQFDNAITKLIPTDAKVNEKKVTSEDVTAEMVDTKSRMEARMAARARYMELMKQAKNMAEVLKVQQEIDDIQEKVEAAGGRVKYLGHAAAFSTINFTYYQVLNPSAGNDTKPSYGVRILESFKSGLVWFGELLVVLVSLWPLWMVVGIVVWVVTRRFRSAGSLAKK